MKDKHTKADSPKKCMSRVFIGCTTEAKPIADAIQRNLAEWCFPEIWSQGFFGPSRTTIESLEENLRKYAFAVILLTADDVAIIRHKKSLIPRDNLIFELGLAVGILTRYRTFIMLPQNINLKLPNDLNGVTFVTYNPDAPNQVAAVSPGCSQIREAIEVEQQHPHLLTQFPSHSLMANIHPHHQGTVQSLLTQTEQAAFKHGVVRRNWNIDLSYCFKRLDTESIITEQIIWEYEFLNITSKPIDYPLQIFCLAGECDKILAFTRVNERGERKPIFTKPETEIECKGLWSKRQRNINLPVGVSHFISMLYKQEQPVSKEHHYIHNSLCPLEPTIGTRLRFQLPKGYRVDAWSREVLKPVRMDNAWEFLISAPLLTTQVIEYMVRKEALPK